MFCSKRSLKWRFEVPVKAIILIRYFQGYFTKNSDSQVEMFKKSEIRNPIRSDLEKNLKNPIRKKPGLARPGPRA